MTEKLGYIEAVFDLRNNLARRFRSGFQEIISRSDTGRPGKSARCVGGGLESQLLRGVSIQQIRLQNSVLNHHRAARGNALAIEGRGAEAAGHGAVVDDGDVRSSNRLPEFARQERGSAIDGVAVHALENMFEHGACDHGIEHHRHVRGLHLARAEASQGAASGFSSDLFRRVELRQAARHRIPVIALHAAAGVLRNGHHCDRTVRPPVFADKAVRIRQHFSAGGGVERSALGVLDAWVGVEGSLFGAARVLDALGAGQRVNVLVIKMEVARKRSELAGLGNARVRIFGTDLRQFERRLQHALDTGGGKIAGIGAGRALSEKDAHTDGARARLF